MATAPAPLPAAIRARWRPAARPALALGAVSLLCLGHTAFVWAGLGGWAGIRGEWPPLLADHGIHYHQAVVTRHFLATTGTTAGYDPSFMSGYAASIVSDLSSTLSDLFVWAFGASRQAFAYKLYVLACAALPPWLVAAAALAWRARPSAVAIAVALFLVYFWTDAPSVFYVDLGMMSYLLSVPLDLLAVAALTGYLGRGGVGRWAASAAACAVVFLVHVTGPLIVGPAGLLAYAVAIVRARRGVAPLPASRHVGFWMIGPVVLAANAFWWVPGWWLASTKGASDYAFSHPESVWGRLAEIVWTAAPIEAVVLGLGLAGPFLLARRDAVAGAGLGGVLLAGLSWGYLAGWFRALDPLQPGRHTMALYTGACVAAGLATAEALARLDRGRGRLALWLSIGALLIAVRLFGPSLAPVYRDRLGGAEPFLASGPDPRLSRLVERLRRVVEPGERLLYEETGRAVPGLRDPFRGRHYSPVIPSATGAEVLGGPFLHATVTTNFTQFGENQLFGKSDWGRDDFVRYARIYRPSAIACWSPHARSFCRAHPDLVRVDDDDGVVLIGRVLGFEGAAIRGDARVTAGPNRVEVRDAVAGDDGLVVLRYHAVPHLVSDPPVAIEPVYLEDDPVPFLAFRPNGGTVVFKLKPAPWSKP